MRYSSHLGWMISWSHLKYDSQKRHLQSYIESTLTRFVHCRRFEPHLINGMAPKVESRGTFLSSHGAKISRPMKRQQSQLDFTFDHKSYQRDVINVKESKRGLDGEHYRMEHALDFGLFLSAAWTPTTVSSCFKSCFEVSRESHDLFSGAAAASPSGLLDSSSFTPPSPLDLRKVTVFLGRWAR